MGALVLEETRPLRSDTLEEFQLEEALRASMTEPAGAEPAAVEAEGIRHRIRFQGARLTVPALLSAIGAQAEVRDLSLAEPAIEDLVRQIYARGPGSVE